MLILTIIDLWIKPFYPITLGIQFCMVNSVKTILGTQFNIVNSGWTVICTKFLVSIPTVIDFLIKTFYIITLGMQFFIVNNVQTILGI